MKLWRNLYVRRCRVLALLPGVLMTHSAVKARFYSLDVLTLQPTVGLIADADLQSYIDSFFQVNPEASKYLIAATAPTIKTWCKALAKAINKRYQLISPSTADSRVEHYTKRMVAMMMARQQSQRAKQLEKNIQEIDQDDSEALAFPSLSLHMVLDQYESQELATAAQLKKWKHNIESPESTTPERKKEIQQGLVDLVATIKEHYELILESLMGLPDAIKRQDLKSEWAALVQSKVDHEGMVLKHMLDYAMRVAAINRQVIKRIGNIVAQTRTLVEPGADETLGNMVQQVRAVIKEIDTIQSEHQDEDQQKLMRDLCVWAALTLWIEWSEQAMVLQMEAQGQVSKERAQLIKQTIQTIQISLNTIRTDKTKVTFEELSQWFSPVFPGSLESLDFMKMWIAQLKELCDLVKNVVRSTSYVRIFSKRLPDLTKRAMDKLTQSIATTQETWTSDDQRESKDADTDNNEAPGEKTSLT